MAPPPADSRRPAAGHAAGGSGGSAIASLTGYTVALATEQRRPALAAPLEEAGAKVVAVQALRVVAQPDDGELRTATEQCLAAPIDELIVTSPFGFRSWLASARGWHLADRLAAAFGRARLLARDGAAADSLREIGLREIWSTAAASTDELLRYLLTRPVAGRRIVVQVDTPSLRELCRALRRRGADVVEVPTCRTFPPSHAEHLRRLADQLIRRQVDAIALTSPEATGNLLEQAERDRRLPDLLNALCDEVTAVCLGPLTAAALVTQGVRPLVGPVGYTDDLVATLIAALPTNAVRVALGHHRLEIRGQAVIVDDRLIPVQPVPIAVLRTLARSPGRVMSCADIRRNIRTGTAVDDHAIEVAISRLRRALSGTQLIRTVMRRGYRLAS
ncbi:uroporphyrinogen-III synthase [Dactylosporangium sucinum]|uniref:Uroporphyrinogen-III synthase n=1 Tax=Dactylosporangium sucinum TaxID=1424081 RepID=A0A917UG27_9ACTN|nr:uroporphyrinogen-III synthase [Dactylosporangium sucinum]GGM90220.1 uroporphyrinogen-III synthase [Dactylosporangium sucinum]